MSVKNAKIVNVKQIPARTPPDGGGFWQRLIQAEDTEAGLLFGFGWLKPGDGRGWHSHPAGEDEIFYVIEGQGLAEWKLEGELHSEPIGAGTAFYTPGDMENNISNVGNSDLLSVFCIYKPS